jgi:adenosylmethionine-8-amino-7-oxononanoate aminotransferase
MGLTAGTRPASAANPAHDALQQSARDHLLRGFLPARLLEAGIIARADDRGDSVLQIAPPLISDAGVLDEIVDALGEVLTDAGAYMGVTA